MLDGSATWPPLSASESACRGRGDMETLYSLARPLFMLGYSGRRQLGLGATG